MSEAAKSARAAMKEKAKRLVKGHTGPVDASGYTQPDMLDADVKTGLRPISRRAFKKGGKVMGEAAEHHAGRRPRKAGGEATAYANAKVNRNVKDANEEREGKKHVGGMKKGGKADDADASASDLNKMTSPEYRKQLEKAPEREPDADDLYAPEDAERLERGYKKGGRTKKMGGGMMDPRAAAAKRMAEADAVAGVPSSQMGFTGIKKGALSPLRGMKKGGTAKHDDAAMDKALIKKMVKPSAQRAKGGECALDGEMQGTRPTGGRKARKDGGRAKGKTNINIVIAQKPDAAPAMPGGPGAPPPMAPMPMPPAGGPPPMGMPAGLPAPPPGAVPPPPGGPGPMMRKAGGRTYPKMRFGAGSGLGRLEKVEEYGLKQ